MSTNADSPYPRDNYWGTLNQDEPSGRGHEETRGTDPAEYLAHQHLLELTDPICERQKADPPWNGGRLAELCAWLFDGEHIDGRGDVLHKRQCEQSLSDPALYLPKQTERNGRIIGYGQFRLRRRYNPESGYVNFGETTSTGVPEVDFETFMQAVHNYLAQRGVRYALVEDWLAYGERLARDPEIPSKEALTIFIRKKRRFDDPEDRGVTDVPDA